jgi:predicted alpha-1,2-mannosidase
VRRLVLALVVLAALVPPAAAGAGEHLTDYVDPMIGTFGAGFVFPGPAAPFGMVQPSPDTDGYFAYTGYQYGDAAIRGFSHVHVESMGVHEGGDLPFMPTTGPVSSTHPNSFKSPFDHATEHAEAGYYRVVLPRYGILAELTAGTRVGVHRYSFPPGVQANLIIDAGHAAAGTDFDPSCACVAPGAFPAELELHPDGTVTGRVSEDYTVYFATRFTAPVVAHGVWDTTGGTPTTGTTIEGTGAGAYVSFAPGQTVEVHTGISFVSRENAKLNLDAEDAAFDAIRARTRAAWEDALRAIVVHGGTLAQRRSFYTSLYHAQHHPNIFEDVNGEYAGHDGDVHPSDGRMHYANFSLWDTYRTQMPLLALIAPDRYRDMMHTLLVMYRERGEFPQWALMNGYPDFMIGEPVLPPIADGFCKDLVYPDDADELYADARAQALVHPRDPSRFTYGYVPSDVDDGGTSITLEHAIADFALALVADARGQNADRDALLERALDYRNVIDPSTGFARPRASDGTWAPDYHPEFPDGFVEGTGWQYTWLAPHDVAGLIDAIGGRDAARQKLDTFFALPAEVQKHLSLFGIAYYGNWYAPVNEHDLQAPYLFDYLGSPWRTQEIVRDQTTIYRPTPDGLPGNDDLGTMSSWFIWTALGVYPETAGAPGYAVGSPLFEKATIRLPGGSFTIDAPGATAAPFVASATLNGQPLDRVWFTHGAFVSGGELAFTTSPVPTSWGADAPPPSLSTNALSDFGCKGST